MLVRNPDGQKEHFVVAGGFLEVSDNRATVLAGAHQRLAKPHACAHCDAEIDREQLSAQAEHAPARLAVGKDHRGG